MFKKETPVLQSCGGIETKKMKVTKYLFITPALLIVAALIIYPICYGTSISFFDTNLVNKWDFIGLKNYADVLKSKNFISSVLTTLKFTVIVVTGHFVLGLVFALLLNRNIKGRVIFRTILMIPWLFPEVVFGTLWKWILNPMYGIVNYILQQWGITNEPISWLGTAKYAFPSLCVIAIIKGYPYIMLMVLAGLQSVPADIYEAGELDGCSGLSKLYYLTLPSILPIIMVVLILDTVQWFKHFNLVAILTNGGPGTTTMLVSNNIYQSAFTNFDFGYASAMAVLIFFICYAIGMAYKKLLQEKGE